LFNAVSGNIMIPLCHVAGGELEQIQFLLGHVSVQTTEKYLGCKQRIRHAVNDRIDKSIDRLSAPVLPPALRDPHEKNGDADCHVGIEVTTLLETKEFCGAARPSK